MSEEGRAAGCSPAERLAMMNIERRQAFFKTLPTRLRDGFLTSWEIQARPAQLPPDGDWRIWMIMAGRGFGKTRAGAQWVLNRAETPALRIALVGPTEDEARSVMIEGASGILACAPERLAWEPSLGRLSWANGTQAFVYSGANPEALRGPEHDYAWCDELAKWPRGEASWDNLMFGLRRGVLPRVLVTTTPRPTPLMRRLAGRGDVALTRGRTADAALLAPGVVDYLTGLYGGTRFGRQELDGELIEDVEGSLWPRDLIERCRVPHADLAAGRTRRRIVVGVDPPVTAKGDACGIVVCALFDDGIAYVLDDLSVRGLSPDGWARAVAGAVHKWSADRVVAEGNQGGEMVTSVLRGADIDLPMKLEHTRLGKSVRAEPVAALFERGAAKFAGVFPQLEDELAGLISGGGYEGPGRSPDRADAMVWAMTELMLGKRRAQPRIRQL
jgi:phage terminase large subunit-like protein